MIDEVKIIKLITGEELVVLLTNMLDDKNDGIGFTLKFPYLVYRKPTPNEEGKELFDINYIAWMSTSANIEFNLVYSSVIAIGDPLPEVKTMYLERYKELLTLIEETNEMGESVKKYIK